MSRIGKADTEGIKELIRIIYEIVTQCNCGGEKEEVRAIAACVITIIKNIMKNYNVSI